MVLIYSIFSFVTNITVGQQALKGGVLDYLSISLGSKAKASTTNTNANNFYLVSSWLGVAMLALWLLALVLIKK